MRKPNGSGQGVDGRTPSLRQGARGPGRFVALVAVLAVVWLLSAIAAARLLMPRALRAAGPADDFPVFTEITEKAGIGFRHSFGDYELTNIVEGTGAGACVFDYNNDGFLDIYFLNGRWNKAINDNRGRDLQGKLSNTLYRNNRDGTFTDVTREAGLEGRGYGFSCSAADTDNDGDADLLVLNYGPNEFYRNNGDGTFTDDSARSGLDNARWSLSAPWIDYNNDGLLDVYVANYLEYDDGKFRAYYAAAGYPGPLSYSGQPDALYRNNGNGTFTEVTKEAGVWNPDGRAMSATAVDLNGDGFHDIYVANDAMENYYYENSGKGTFQERALEMGLAFGEHGQGVSSMGPVFGDVDRDGRMDLFIPDMGYGSLLMNRGKFFEDRITASNLAVICGQYTGWGALLSDFDNDGWLDLFMSSGNAHHEYAEDAVLARNNGSGGFVDVASTAGPYFRAKHVARGATVADFDNDGDLDIVVVHLNGRAALLRNEGARGRNWLTVVTKLRNGKTDAIGARVTVVTGLLKQSDFVLPVRGYLSQAEPRPHFGLGSAAKADLVEIRWPSGRFQRLKDIKANQILTVVEGR